MRALPRRRWPWIALAVVVLLLVGVHLALPGWVRDFLNAKLDRMGEYHGSVQDVDLHLWRGAIVVDGLRIVKRSEKIPVPLLAVQRASGSLSWNALLHGGVVASIDVWQPEVNFVDGEDRAQQTGAGVDWRKRVEDLIPIRLDEVRIHDGKLHFRNFTSEPPVDLQATDIQARILNLTNVRDKRGRAADMDVRARVLGQAPLQAHMSFDPFESLDDFEFRIKLTQIELRRLNDFLQAYANLDVQSGAGDFVMELEARDKQLSGYAKPLFRDVRIFSVKQDIQRQKDNPLRALWEAIAGGIENLFKNPQQDQFATRVEIRGRIGDAETSAWQAIAAVIRNAFVEAYRPQFENLPTQDTDPDSGSQDKS